MFEVCVGVFWPSMSTMRSKYIPEASTLHTAASILCALTNGNYTNVGFVYLWLVVRRVLIWEKCYFRSSASTQCFCVILSPSMFLTSRFIFCVPFFNMSV